MNKAKLLISIVVLLWNNISSFGQLRVNSSSSLQTPKEYYLQVKQFGEFIDRFNYKSDWKGNLITAEFTKKVSRANYLLYLLNAEDERLSNPIDSSYRLLCTEFITYINDPNNPKTISLYNGQVKAWVKLNINYAGKELRVSMELTPEVLKDRSAKWAISKIEADCFASIIDSLQAHFIAPNSHETNFINIKKLNYSSNPIYYFSAPIATDPTLLFLSEVAKNHIRIKSTEQVTYHISFQGWEITVDEFNRTSTNSGWLISNIKKN